MPWNPRNSKALCRVWKVFQRHENSMTGDACSPDMHKHVLMHFARGAAVFGHLLQHLSTSDSIATGQALTITLARLSFRYLLFLSHTSNALPLLATSIVARFTSNVNRSLLSVQGCQAP